MIAFVLSVT